MKRNFWPLAALCLAAITLFGLTREPPAAQGCEYAVLARASTESTRGRADSWRLSSPAETLIATSAEDLLKQVGGARQANQSLDSSLVNAVASRGWELVTHAHSSTAYFDSSAIGPVRTTTEEWWFRRAH